MPADSRKAKDKSQRQRFIDAARETGASEDAAVFRENLKRLVQHKPKSDAKCDDNKRRYSREIDKMTCDCGGQRNQTSKAAFEILAEKKIDVRSEMGAGLFLMPDPEAGPLRYRKVFVHDLSYIDVQVRGINCVAFKWFPYSWMDKAAITKLDLNPDSCYQPRCSGDGECTNGPECFCAGSAGCT